MVGLELGSIFYSLAYLIASFIAPVWIYFLKRRVDSKLDYDPTTPPDWAPYLEERKSYFLILNIIYGGLILLGIMAAYFGVNSQALPYLPISIIINLFCWLYFAEKIKFYRRKYQSDGTGAEISAISDILGD